MFSKVKYLLPVLFFQMLTVVAFGQPKSFVLGVKGDTINIVDKNGLKQGRWVVHVDPLRGEPGYEEEGVYVNDKKEGLWRKYSLTGDIIAMENFFKGGKDGLSQYFTPFGDLIREENWRAYNPDSPYDTIPIYGEGNNEIINYKIVKAEPYSVKHGNWTYYDPQTGRIIKTDKYDRNRLLSSPIADMLSQEVDDEEPMKKIKPKEVLEYEKKNSGKKKVRVRDGRTGT